MISQEILKSMIQIVENIPHAALYFEELSRIQAVKPNIDIVRRRKAASERHGIKLTQESAFDFFKALQECKLGKLNVIEGRSVANHSFTWTEKSFGPVELGIAVMSCLNERPAKTKSIYTKPYSTTPYTVPENGNHTSMTFMLRLSSGQVLKLNKTDINELKEFIDSIE